MLTANQDADNMKKLKENLQECKSEQGYCKETALSPPFLLIDFTVYGVNSSE